MTIITMLQYISRSGLRAEVGHQFDDPYLGNPKSNVGQKMSQDGPVGLVWMANGKEIQKRFESRIQAVMDLRSDRIVVIGHWNSPLDGSTPPNNGIVFDADGAVTRVIAIPKEILGKRSPNGQILRPEGLSVVKRVEGEIEIWLSYWQGDWHEQRIYEPESGSWGRVTGQYRAV